MPAIWASLLSLTAVAACGEAAEENSVARPEEVSLFTSLPLVWPEQASVRDHLARKSGKHWAIEELERYGRVRLIDSLVDVAGTPRLSGGLLVMAQPRPLTPLENVALDEWVRSGGRLLLFADPMLTAETGFPLGDPRRPQDIVMISPILSHWGLELHFDADQPAGERKVGFNGTAIPVNLPGNFSTRKGEANCSVSLSGMVVQCMVGKGRILAMADAALLEVATDSEDAKERSSGLNLLLHTVGHSN